MWDVNVSARAFVGKWPAFQFAALVLLAGVLSVHPLAAQGYTPAGVSEPVARALELLCERDYVQARKVCKSAKRLAGEDAAYCSLVAAVSSNRLGDFKGGIKAARRVVDSAQSRTLRAGGYGELGIGLSDQVKSKEKKWPRIRPSGGSVKILLEAEEALRKSLQLHTDESGDVQFALAEVLLTLSVYHYYRWSYYPEVKDLLTTFLARQPQGRRADWARDVTCSSDFYLEGGEPARVVSPNTLVKPPRAQAGQPRNIGRAQDGQEVTRPEKLYAPGPSYSELGRLARVQGVVIVQAIIDKNGDIVNVAILKGLPFCLDAEAVKMIKTWKFKPAMLGPDPVDVYYNLTVNFRLK